MCAQQFNSWCLTQTVGELSSAEVFFVWYTLKLLGLTSVSLFLHMSLWAKMV